MAVLVASLEERIKKAELRRENGYPAEAREELTEIIRAAEAGLVEEDVVWCGSSEQEIYNLRFVIAQALGHRIVCNEHMRSSAGPKERALYDQLILNDISLGMRLRLPDHHKAVFYYRKAKFSIERGEFHWARLPLTCAYQMVKKGGHEEAEYLSLMAEFDLRTKGPGDALRRLDKAFGILESAADAIEPWHRLILESSILGRRYRAHVKSGEYLQALSAGLLGYGKAWWVWLRYGKPQRLRAFHFGQ